MAGGVRIVEKKYFEINCLRKTKSGSELFINSACQHAGTNQFALSCTG